MLVNVLSLKEPLSGSGGGGGQKYAAPPVHAADIEAGQGNLLHSSGEAGSEIEEKVLLRHRIKNGVRGSCVRQKRIRLHCGRIGRFMPHDCGPSGLRRKYCALRGFMKNPG